MIFSKVWTHTLHDRTGLGTDFSTTMSTPHPLPPSCSPPISKSSRRHVHLYATPPFFARPGSLATKTCRADLCRSSMASIPWLPQPMTPSSVQAVFTSLQRVLWPCRASSSLSSNQQLLHPYPGNVECHQCRAGIRSLRPTRGAPCRVLDAKELLRGNSVPTTTLANRARGNDRSMHLA